MAAAQRCGYGGGSGLDHRLPGISRGAHAAGEDAVHAGVSPERGGQLSRNGKAEAARGRGSSRAWTMRSLIWSKVSMRLLCVHRMLQGFETLTTGFLHDAPFLPLGFRRAAEAIGGKQVQVRPRPTRQVSPPYSAMYLAPFSRMTLSDFTRCMTQLLLA